MATGLGKTVCFSYLPDIFPELFDRGMLVLVHREELVEQAADKLARIHQWATIAIEQAHRSAHPSTQLVVASVQTLGRKGSSRINKFRDRFGIVVVDEAHHISVGSQYDRVLRFFGLSDSDWKENDESYSNEVGGIPRLLLGVTATPNRHDGKGLQHWFDELAFNRDLRWGVENGWLTDIRAVKIKTPVDISTVKTRAGDFAINELEKKVNTHERHDVIVKGFADHGGSRGIAFCTTIQHAVDLAYVFNTHGIEASCVHSKLDDDERHTIIQGFRDGDFRVLTNVGIATEGFDVPEIDTLIMARPTKSTMLYQQMIGRGTRPIIGLNNYDHEQERVEAIKNSDKPHMMVIDYTDNCGKHELVTMPTLFGLTPKFDYHAQSVIKTEQIIEGMERKHPSKDLRVAKNLDDVQVLAKRLSLWDTAAAQEAGLGISPYTWLHRTGNVSQLVVPGALARKRNCIIRVEPDRLGRYVVTAHYPGGWDPNIKAPVRSRTVESKKLYPDRKSAIQGVDKWVNREYPSVLNLISRSGKWRGKLASDPQRSMIRRMYKTDPPPDLTRGQAAVLINQAIAEGKR
jgi:ATP-dependent helicase IRC3